MSTPARRRLMRDFKVCLSRRWQLSSNPSSRTLTDDSGDLSLDRIQD